MSRSTHLASCVLSGFLILAGAMWPGSGALASVPTGTEAASVEGKGAAEVGVNVGLEKDENGGSTATETTLTPWIEYGLTDALDLYLEVPWMSWKLGGAKESGVSDATLALKWMVYSSDGLSVALRPSISFPTGDDAKGLGSGKTNFGLILTAGIPLKPVDLTLNLGYSSNQNDVDEETALFYLSAEADWGVAPGWTLAGEVRVDTDPDKTSKDPAYLLVGIDHNLSEKLSIGVGFKTKLNDAAPDSGLVVGLTFGL
jgi:hypothetical protein